MAEGNNSAKAAGIGCGALAGGCLLVIVIALIAVAAGVWYVASNAKNIMADAGGAVAVQMVEDSQLPQDQKDRIVGRIDEVKEGFKAGEVTQEQLGAIFEALAQSPLFHVAMVEHFNSEYVQPSALSEEEKQDARRTLDRFARGVFNESISADAFDEVTNPISTVDSQGNQQLKQNPTVEELREALTLAREKADAAGVPDEPFEINYADEFDKAVDAALAGQTDIEIEGDASSADDVEAPAIEEAPADAAAEPATAP